MLSDLNLRSALLRIAKESHAVRSKGHASLLTSRRLLLAAFLTIAVSPQVHAQTELAVFPDPAEAGQELLVAVAYTSAGCGAIPTLHEAFRTADSVVLEILDPGCPILPCCFDDYTLTAEITPLPVGTYTFEVRRDDTLLDSQQVEILPFAPNSLAITAGTFVLPEGENVVVMVEGTGTGFFDLGNIDIDTIRAVDGLRLAPISVVIEPQLPGDPPVPEPFVYILELGRLPVGQYFLSTEFGSLGPATNYLEIELPDDPPDILNVSPTNPTTADTLTALIRLEGNLICDPMPAVTFADTEEVHVELDAACFDGDPDQFGTSVVNFGPLDAGTYVIVLSDRGGAELDRQVIEVEPAGGCAANDTTLCLLRHRFEARVLWGTTSGTLGPGHVQTVTNGPGAASGAFWFFDPANVELEVKVLNGCDINGHFWVFAAGLTDVGVRLTVEDTVFGGKEFYLNELGSPFEVGRDIEAFPCQ